MVNSVNINNNYPVSNTGLKQEDIQNTLAKSKQAVNENLESNSAVQVLSNNVNKKDSMYKKLLFIPILNILDKAVDKKIGGEAEKSLLNKFANAGDTVSHFLHLDNVVSSSNLNKISNFIKNNKFTKYFTNEFSAVAKCPFAKSQTMAEKYSKEILDSIIKLKENPEFIAEIESKAGSLTDDTVNLIKGLTKESNYTIEQITNIAEKLSANNIETINSAAFTQLLNKFKAANSKFGQTFIGKAFAKTALKTKDTITFGGGLISLFFTASALYEAYQAAKEAPKGEKKSAFMHVLSEQYIGILLFQPSINLLYKIGGNKYRGMTVEAREYLKDLIKNTNVDETLTKEGLKIAKLQRNLLIKGVDKDKVAQLTGKGFKEAAAMAKTLKKEGAKLKLWERPLKFMGRILDMGLDKLQKATYVTLPKLGKVRLPKPTIKGFAGGLGRFLLIMMVIQPIIQKPVTKLVHKIFGEPKEYLAKKNQENNKQEKNTPAKTEEQPAIQNPQQQNGTNLLNLYSKNNPSSGTSAQNIQTQIPAQQQTQTQTQAQPQEALPAFNLFKKKDDSQEYSGYIPDIKVDNSYIDKREKEIEKQVNETLKHTDKIVKETKKMLN